MCGRKDGDLLLLFSIAAAITAIYIVEKKIILRVELALVCL
jgi:hypothetical protein